MRTKQPAEDGPYKGDYLRAFVDDYQREYGFTLTDRLVLVDNIRVRVVGSTESIQRIPIPKATENSPPAIEHEEVYFSETGRVKTPVFDLSKLHAGHEIEGPAVIIDKTNTIVVLPNCKATITEYGDVRITIGKEGRRIVGYPLFSPFLLFFPFLELSTLSFCVYAYFFLTCEFILIFSLPTFLFCRTALDTIQLSLFSNRFMSIAEQMGKTLQRTSISTNIKERLDFSCALFGVGVISYPILFASVFSANLLNCS